MSAAPILTIYNQHTARCGIPPALTKESPTVYVGYFENRFGEQWIFTFDRTTREARLRGGPSAHDCQGAGSLQVRRSGRLPGQRPARWPGVGSGLEVPTASPRVLP